MMMMGKGKGDARRKVTATFQKDELNEDIADAFNALSSNDKKRLLAAIKNDDVKVVDAIFDGDRPNGRKLPRIAGMEDEPTPEDLFGLLGIFPSFCESKVGSTFKKCQPPPAPQMMMGKGGRRAVVAVSFRDEESNEDIVDAFNALSSDNKKRLLMAIQRDDVNMVDDILEGNNKNSERALQRNSGINNEPTPEELFGKLGIFPSFCESKVGQKLVKCLTKSPTLAPVGKSMMTSTGMMGKRARSVMEESNDEDEVADELLQLYNTMTSKDKKRWLTAMEQEDVEVLDELWTQYNHHHHRW